jgi:carbonic anhydrase
VALSRIDDMVEANRDYASRFAGDLPSLPATGVAVLTCMDARLHVGRLLGLTEGDAHVIRNAGAAVTDDAIRSLAVSQRLVGTREVMVIAHTDCAMRTFSDSEFRAELEAETGTPPGWLPEEFSDPEVHVRRSVARIRRSPFVPHTDAVRGFVFDVEDGTLREVADEA